MLCPGDPAPMFQADTSVNPAFKFDTVAGRYTVLCLFGSAADPFVASLLGEVEQRHDFFDAASVFLMAVSIDPGDRARLTQRWPGVVYAWDTDRAISRLYDALPPAGADDAPTAGPVEYRARSVILDQAMRVLGVIPFHTAAPPADHVEQVVRAVSIQPPLDRLDMPAPVLLIPHVFEPPFCRALIDYYAAHGGEPSGFMREVGGRTVPVSDPSFKRRADCEIVDGKMIRSVHERISRRVAPAIEQAYQFRANRIERHIVACYDAADGGHFKAHRDNTTRGTAHRRFAVSINLNTPDFEGGELWFPEFGPRHYKAPAGWAVIFSCSLLHEVMPVTAGRRFAFLPFLYDDAAAAVRERNRQFLYSAAPAESIARGAGALVPNAVQSGATP